MDGKLLVEAGTRCVTVAFGFWDTHGDNFNQLRSRLPMFDRGVSALVEDIYQRGLDEDVTVVVWGEFGRTPKINKDAGRDHWAPVNGALLAGGGMAEEVVVDGRHALPVPEGVSLAEAAVLPEVYATAWLNLYQLAALRPGEKVLLHAGASGVGSAAIQLCKAFGNPCWVSVGSAERLAYCEALGAQGGVVRKDDLQALRDFAPFDVILDPVGASYAALNLQLLALDGRWINIGLMGGREAQLDFALLLGKRIQLLGSTLRNRDELFKAELMHDLAQHVWPLFASGQLKPQLAQTFAAADVEAAFAALASNQVSGKLVLSVDASLL